MVWSFYDIVLDMAHVYILESDSGKYYIGSTNNLHERLKHHFGGYTPSTKRLCTLHLVLDQEYSSLEDARYIESRLKKLKRKDYFERIIKDGFIKIKPKSLALARLFGLRQII